VVVVVVVVVVAATPNYLRQASQNLGKYSLYNTISLDWGAVAFAAALHDIQITLYTIYKHDLKRRN